MKKIFSFLLLLTAFSQGEGWARRKHVVVPSYGIRKEAPATSEELDLRGLKSYSAPEADARIEGRELFLGSEDREDEGFEGHEFIGEERLPQEGDFQGQQPLNGQMPYPGSMGQEEEQGPESLIKEQPFPQEGPASIRTSGEGEYNFSLESIKLDLSTPDKLLDAADIAIKDSEKLLEGLDQGKFDWRKGNKGLSQMKQIREALGREERAQLKKVREELGRILKLRDEISKAEKQRAEYMEKWEEVRNKQETILDFLGPETEVPQLQGKINEKSEERKKVEQEIGQLEQGIEQLEQDEGSGQALEEKKEKLREITKELENLLNEKKLTGEYIEVTKEAGRLSSELSKLEVGIIDRNKTLQELKQSSDETIELYEQLAKGHKELDKNLKNINQTSKEKDLENLFKKSREFEEFFEKARAQMGETALKFAEKEAAQIAEIKKKIAEERQAALAEKGKYIEEIRRGQENRQEQMERLQKAIQ